MHVCVRVRIIWCASEGFGVLLPDEGENQPVSLCSVALTCISVMEGRQLIIGSSSALDELLTR